MSELIVLIVVALVVIGPKDLPKVLKKVGYWAGRLRRMAGELRAQSGIDDVLHNEGLHESIVEIRKLARGEIESVKRSVDISGADLGTAALATAGAAAAASSTGPTAGLDDIRIDREREYPKDGADGYLCLPDTAIVYDGTLPFTDLDRDPLYVLGDAAAVVPPRPQPEPDEEPAPEGDGGTGEDAPAAEASADGEATGAPEAPADAAAPEDVEAPKDAPAAAADPKPSPEPAAERTSAS